MLTTFNSDRAPVASAQAPGGEKLSITVIILTLNEEIHIERCIASVASFVQRIVVVNSFSSDRTVEIAKRLGAEVTQRAFKHQADQFQWALDNCQIATDWVLRLDADEYFEPSLAAEIVEKLPSLPEHVTGGRLKRKVFFRDRWIRHGGYYPAIFLRLWRTGAACIEQRWMDEYAVLTRGESITLEADFVDHNLRDIGWWVDKHNRYATRQMVDFVNREVHLFPIDEAMEVRAHAQSQWKRFLRNRVFAQAPLYLRSVLYFLYRYVLRLGFLDGKSGFLFHTFQGLWYFLLIDSKIEEARVFIRTHGADAFRQRLADHYKIDLTMGKQGKGADDAKRRCDNPTIRGLRERQSVEQSRGTRHGGRSLPQKRILSGRPQRVGSRTRRVAAEKGEPESDSSFVTRGQRFRFPASGLLLPLLALTSFSSRRSPSSVFREISSSTTTGLSRSRQGGWSPPIAGRRRLGQHDVDHQRPLGAQFAAPPPAISSISFHYDAGVFVIVFGKIFPGGTQQQELSHSARGGAAGGL